MSRLYRTIDGDMLDAICQRLLGSETHAPEVLAANPRLAALGPVYPAGVLITLPDIAAPVAPEQIRLWGRT
ncbi:tail protein X [Paracoccus shanxieyensis]|uniref:Phage tail protein n=1 Tax=Paracoccus shanxieyensis TaxID=2675752 RepID=A0A6L6J2I0_9RHOB|nr:tail protein X [Paracoccus shanxieyensis]MTH65592.1 phage tail protein [Paracoccus shanxieyensis]MTH88833.1 phage tail protein [Paracoccus shanxieyensis]